MYYNFFFPDDDPHVWLETLEIKKKIKKNYFVPDDFSTLKRLFSKKQLYDIKEFYSKYLQSFFNIFPRVIDF